MDLCRPLSRKVDLSSHCSGSHLPIPVVYESGPFDTQGWGLQVTFSFSGVTLKERRPDRDGVGKGLSVQRYIPWCSILRSSVGPLRLPLWFWVFPLPWSDSCVTLHHRLDPTPTSSRPRVGARVVGQIPSRGRVSSRRRWDEGALLDGCDGNGSDGVFTAEVAGHCRSFLRPGS